MRELKFRAWNKRDHKMIYAPYHLLHDGYFDYNFKNNVSQNYIEPEYVMQYTGRKDKTGKEIYEGDYIKWEDYIGLVKFCLDKSEHYAPAFYIELEKVDENSERYSIFRHDKNYKLQRYFASEPPVVEIIGNVYETPELLKKD